MFGEVPFLLSPHPDGHRDGPLAWVAPNQTYVDEPFASTGLAALYQWEEIEYEDEDLESDWEEPECTRLRVSTLMSTRSRRFLRSSAQHRRSRSATRPS